MCIGACTCICTCMYACDNAHSCVDTYMCSSAHCVADGGDAMATSCVLYRDGIRSKGDKIGMACTHNTVIHKDVCNSQPTRIYDKSPILSQRHTTERVMYIRVHMPCV